MTIIIFSTNKFNKIIYFKIFNSLFIFNLIKNLKNYKTIILIFNNIIKIYFDSNKLIWN